MATACKVTAIGYPECIRLLNSLQSNAQVISKQVDGQVAPDRDFLLVAEQLRLVGYDRDQLNRLNVVHIAGTKGKGSCCAFISNILTRHGLKTGLLTSPHMRGVRERIRINGRAIPEGQFARCFSDVWGRLSASAMPGYPRFLTLLALHVFLQEQVDASVLEVGLGGRYDPTNVVPRPLATGITSIGIDHVRMLGSTAEEIAWNKAGIAKPGVPLFVGAQPFHPNAVPVFQRESLLVGAPIAGYVLGGGRDSRWVAEGGQPRFQVSERVARDLPAHQVENATLALAMTSFVLGGRFSKDSAEAAILETRWPGRNQWAEKEGKRFYLDGAHTVESLTVACKAFLEAPVDRFVLVFFCIGARDSVLFLKTIYSLTREKVAHAIFVSPRNFSNLECLDANWNEQEATKKLEEMQDGWEGSSSSLCQDIKSCLRVLSIKKESTVFVTGSLRLVAGFMEHFSLPCEDIL